MELSLTAPFANPDHHDGVKAPSQFPLEIDRYMRGVRLPEALNDPGLA
jgi:hypothetical protein